MSPLYQRRGAPDTGHSIELLPNPDFVFPAGPADASPSLDNWNALNSRSQPSQSGTIQSLPPSGARSHRSRGSAALPDFVFNPAATTSSSNSQLLVTPPHSPSLPSPTTPSRPIGHRRGGSEFIGGDGKGGAGLLSTSPVKGEAALPAPRMPARLGPPPGGRGHRHRRSGAISCHDLQSIMQPQDSSNNGENRGGSAPATPLETEQKPFFAQTRQRRTASQAEFRSSPEQTRLSSDNSPPRATPRVRVGFSDRVEYIRPLSTISSETESSLSTIRGGHSVSGSLSSVISLSTASPPSTRMARLPLQTTFEDDSTKARPQSSGNILETMFAAKSDMRPSIDEEERPKSAIASPVSDVASSVATSESKSPKRRSFGWWESKRPQHTLRSSISEPSLVACPPTSPDGLASPPFTGLGEEAGLEVIEKHSKSKKSRSWTRSLISRKSKSHNNLKSKSVQERLPTPPALPISTPSEPSPVVDDSMLKEEPSFEPNFDIDETVTIVSNEPRPSLSIAPWQSRLQNQTDPMSPVIDLDAALGPFNTPHFGANTRLNSGSQPRPRRSMHSLGYQSMNNHRRSESAPELVPFDLRNTKMAVTNAMPDVFEEEDEEAEAELGSQIGSPVITPASEITESALGIKLDDATESPVVQARVASYSSMNSQLRPPMTEGKSSGQSLSPSVSSARGLSVEVVEDFEEPRAASFTRDSDSTITPPLTAEDEKSPRPIVGLQLPLPHQPVMTPETLTASSFSSRQFSNSQISLNTPRLGTATSSIAESRSINFGEPGPAVRMSVDDVPSLSSSRSTMTTPPQYPFMFAGPYASDGRKSSVTSIPSLNEQQRRSKRASVASLSRLVGGKSKLSIETRPQSQHIMSTTMMERPSKTKKGNRLSKLMQFWKKQTNDSRRDSIA